MPWFPKSCFPFTIIQKDLSWACTGLGQVLSFNYQPCQSPCVAPVSVSLEIPKITRITTWVFLKLRSSVTEKINTSLVCWTQCGGTWAFSQNSVCASAWLNRIITRQNYLGFGSQIFLSLIKQLERKFRSLHFLMAWMGLTSVVVLKAKNPQQPCLWNSQ